jgi:hypothetical protein
LNDEVNEDEMSRASSTNVEEINAYRMFVGKSVRKTKT